MSTNSHKNVPILHSKIVFQLEIENWEIKGRKNIGIYYRSTCSQCVYKFSTSRAARPLGFGVMWRHHSAFEADLSQQYRRAWGQTIGAGFSSHIGLKSHNFKGIDYVTHGCVDWDVEQQSIQQTISINCDEHLRTTTETRENAIREVNY